MTRLRDHRDDLTGLVGAASEELPMQMDFLEQPSFEDCLATIREFQGIL